MSINLARTAEAWWAVTPAGLVRLGLPAATTAELLADRAALTAAIEAAQATAAAAPRDAVPAESLDLLSPVTAPARVVAQAVNYRSHAIDSGFDPDTVPPAFFRKASHSITGPAGDIIRPDGVGFLDYEVELGLVIGTDLPVGTTVTEADLARYVAALVVANDVSARQIQLVKTQFYESKSYPTFTPVGPWLTLVDAADLARLGSLRLTLSVNGQVRQDNTVAADMIVRPAQALTLLSRFQPMAPGDLLLTGTPGGTALKAPAKIAGTARRAAAARHPVEAVLQPAGGQPPLPARRRRHHRDDRLPRRAARPRHPAQHDYREAAMTTREILPLPESTYQLLLDAAGAWPDAVATQWIPDPGDYTRCLDWTYAELAGTVTRIANALTALGVRREDAVTLASVNTSMLYAATLAAQAVGIAAPVNPALSGERIAELIRRTGSRVLVAAGPELDPQLWQRLLEVARQAGMTAVLALRPDGARGTPPALDPAGDAPADGTPNGRAPVVAYLDEVIAGQPDSHLAGADLPEADDLAAFVHTGGTTGAPKVAAHTHANQLACGRGIALCSGLAAGEGMLGGLPLFHVNALIVTGIAPMFSGARVVWPGPAGYRDRALYARFWKIVEHYRIAAMSAVPTVYGTLAQVPVDADISSLRLPIVGAAPLPSSVREDFAAHTGLHLLEGYGLTEATCASTWTRPGEERPGSVGRVLPGQQIKAVRIGDGSWADCAPGETGELVIGGPAVFAGYVTDPDLGGPRVSREGIVHDGWLDTGDLGMVDAGGFVYLTGRAKDLIIRGGHNIDPRVIEDALLRHPAVRAAVAVGRPDRHSGEVPVAYVVPADPGRFDEAELLAWAGTAIDEPAARPKHIYPIDAIPVTEVGKHFKPALVADAAVRAITEALTAAGVADARVTAAHEDGRLVVTVTGADPGRVRDAVAGFALTVRSGPSPTAQTTNK